MQESIEIHIDISEYVEPLISENLFIALAQNELHEYIHGPYNRLERYDPSCVYQVNNIKKQIMFKGVCKRMAIKIINVKCMDDDLGNLSTYGCYLIKCQHKACKRITS